MNNTPTPRTDACLTFDSIALCETLERELAAVTEQRDRLAEALRVINTYDPKNGQCDDGYTPVFHARKALAAVKGGSDE